MDVNSYNNYRQVQSSDSSLYYWFIEGLKKYSIIIFICIIIFKIIIFLLLSVSLYNYTTIDNNNNNNINTYHPYDDVDIWIERPKNLRYIIMVLNNNNNYYYY